jgi:hypothetical protein
LIVASAALVTMFVAPGPMEDVTASVALRRRAFAKALAMWTSACSLRPCTNGSSSWYSSRRSPVRGCAATR